uniref:Odorant receptor n=1 Tax=Locusta migratoria TaxID=7004 RepID=A0A0M4IUA6_LOCMI|nr:odorant receptor 103 [Locusta migratoria]
MEALEKGEPTNGELHLINGTFTGPQMAGRSCSSPASYSKYFHDAPVSGHLGFVKTLDWKGFYRSVNHYEASAANGAESAGRQEAVPRQRSRHPGKIRQDCLHRVETVDGESPRTGVTVTVVLWMGDPLLQMLTSPAGNSSRPLIFWVPLEVRHSPAYEITYAVQALGIAAIGQTSILMDIFFVVLLLQAASEIAVLNENIAGMGFKKLRDRENESEEHTSIQRVESSTYVVRTSYVLSECTPHPEISSDNNGNPFAFDRGHKYCKMYSTLVRNIRHHQHIIAYVKDLEVVMSTSLYLLLLANALNVCLHSFGFVALFQEGATRSTVIKEVLSFPSFLGQTALYCFFGQVVIDQADRLHYSAFSCDWPHADEPFRRSLRIFMMQAARPLNVKVGKLVTLSRKTFLQALNTSYTIFNMLFNVERRS